MIAFRRLLSLAALSSVLAVAVLTPPAMVAAADEGHSGASAAHEKSEHHVATIGDLLFPAINFAMYLIVMVRFVVPAMSEYLQRRHTEITSSQFESTELLAQAQKDLATSQARLAQLPTEANAIRQDLIAVADRQAERLKSQAEESGSRRLADASLLAEQERRHAFASLRSELATVATERAEDLIRNALTSEDQRLFVLHFLRDATAR